MSLEAVHHQHAFDSRGYVVGKEKTNNPSPDPNPESDSINLDGQPGVDKQSEGRNNRNDQRGGAATGTTKIVDGPSKNIAQELADSPETGIAPWELNCISKMSSNEATLYLEKRADRVNINGMTGINENDTMDDEESCGSIDSLPLEKKIYFYIEISKMRG